MGKQYYCDYCDKSFSDKASNRSKHLSSLNHKIALSEHYKKYDAPLQIVKDEIKKKTCTEFNKRGFCKFRNACMFSHLSRENLDILKTQLKQYKESKLSTERKVSEIDVNRIVDRLGTDQSDRGTERIAKRKRCNEVPMWLAKEELPPQSLKPLSKTIDTSQVNTWG